MDRNLNEIMFLSIVKDFIFNLFPKLKVPSGKTSPSTIIYSSGRF